MLPSVLVVMLAASAAPPEMRWDAPGSCPDDSVVRDRLGQLLGVDASNSPAAAGVRIDAEVTQRGGEYRLRLTVEEGDDVRLREASASDCATLAEAATLIAATFVDPVQTTVTVQRAVAPAVASSSQPRPAAPVLPEPPRSERPSVVAPAARPPPVVDGAPGPPTTSPERHGALRLSLVGGRATQPDVDVGPSLAGAWFGARFRLEVALTALIPRTRTHSTLPGVTLTQSLYALTVRGCGGPGRPRWALALCAGTEVGAVVATGGGVLQPRTTASPWGAVVLGMQAIWRLSPRWSLFAGPEGVVGYAISAFTVGDQTPQPVGSGGIRGQLGVELFLR